ncbi:Phytanoyl-CoA dioxygenase [Necator americanus]|uniref:Phytanoyl-CoA dioxygenase n=1 Tax=Necator americanus TaxID=51031 RepID=W2TQ20_NECAM|nr:Phytanoyl-CoA dioxygenase [Necator americanus]ETN83122.1 Phytanoyl-CoA dioxygenase [Necator americanus]
MSWLKKFEEHGYAVVEDVFTTEEVMEMKAEIERVIDGIDFDRHPKSVFSTYDEDKIRVFFEEGAFDGDGKLAVERHKALNKIGHGSSVDYRFVRTHKTDGSPLLKFNGTRPTYDQTKFVNVPIKKGSLIIIHGLVVHKSAPNLSQNSRHAYTLHVMEGKNTKWSEDNCEEID